MTSPASPAATPVRFADLPDVHEHVAQALAKSGITDAFPIQAAVLPEAAAGTDMLVRSPTGSGKTLAFGLPLIAQLKRGTTRPSAVILVPSRELAIQVRDELVPIAWALQLRVAAVFGGAPAYQQAKQAKQAAIVVATPGRLADLIRRRQIDVREVSMLVLDEADRMLDMGFAPQVQEIVDALPKRNQTMLFSATLEGRVGKIADALTDNPVRVERDEAPGEGGQIEHVLLGCSAAAKSDALFAVLDDPKRELAVVFVRTQKGADNLTDRLLAIGARATKIHGGMTQQERLRQFERFSRGQCDVLVATDVFSRGMDLDKITHVVNYELPEDADAFRHRAGRTGRAGRSGTAITLVTPNQRGKVRAMLRANDLPIDLLTAMQNGSTERRREVAPEDRHTDPKSRDAARPRSFDKGKGRKIPYKGNDAPRSKGNFKDAKPQHATKGNWDAERARANAERPTNDRTKWAKQGTGADRPGGKTFDRPHAASKPSSHAGGNESGRGTIISYDPKKGFGFIKQQGGGKDVFFHRRSLGEAPEQSLRSGLPVAFGLDRATGPKLRAATVKIRGGRS